MNIEDVDIARMELAHKRASEICKEIDTAIPEVESRIIIKPEEIATYAVHLTSYRDDLMRGTVRIIVTRVSDRAKAIFSVSAEMIFDADIARDYLIHTIRGKLDKE